jgi:hypothetical protein
MAVVHVNWVDHVTTVCQAKQRENLQSILAQHTTPIGYQF